jgi:hypothetical protein
MVYHDQYLFKWHVNGNIIRNEKLSDEQKIPVGYFKLVGNKWMLINQTLTSLKDLTEDTIISPGSSLELTDGKKILLSTEEGGRVVIVTIANK